jgi:hypothetical protein
MMEVSFSHEENSDPLRAVTPVKYWNSSNDVMSLLPLNAVPKSVTAAASASLSSPSQLVSQFCTQIALTPASANEMFCADAKIGSRVHIIDNRYFFIA